MSEKDGCLHFEWDALDALFPDGLLDDMFAAYCNLLDQLCTDAGLWKQTSAIDYLPERQRQQRLAYNATTTQTTPQLLHELIQSQVQSGPEQAAVISSSKSLSYGDLDGLSNQLAHRLRSLGAVPNQLIAVVMDKGWQQVVACLLYTSPSPRDLSTSRMPSSA